MGRRGGGRGDGGGNVVAGLDPSAFLWDTDDQFGSKLAAALSEPAWLAEPPELALDMLLDVAVPGYKDRSDLLPLEIRRALSLIGDPPSDKSDSSLPALLGPGDEETKAGSDDDGNAGDDDGAGGGMALDEDFIPPPPDDNDNGSGNDGDGSDRGGGGGAPPPAAQSRRRRDAAAATVDHGANLKRAQVWAQKTCVGCKQPSHGRLEKNRHHHLHPRLVCARGCALCSP